MSGSESEPVRRLMRHSSFETINTNITSADEFVWVDNHTRLVELQRVPWSNHDILKVMQTGRLREHLGQISMETVPVCRIFCKDLSSELYERHKDFPKLWECVPSKR
ncbi:hypothetical protein AVEN_193191-1 [Araneus ventricosus]|uniref:Uncharacterized protein n=1 Tax=Araneus ventricosus TaxID=182803 RepID=A0A4Y2B381_ARAVE|nr:hypothetical protein AVEN_193191-1 [Araneus ventricosus]